MGELIGFTFQNIKGKISSFETIEELTPLKQLEQENIFKGKMERGRNLHINGEEKRTCITKGDAMRTCLSFDGEKPRRKAFFQT